MVSPCLPSPHLWGPIVVICGWWVMDNIVSICYISWLGMCRCRMRCDGQRHYGEGRVPAWVRCNMQYDGQARGFVPMHHAVAKGKWRLSAEWPEEFGRSHGRSTWCTIRARVQEELNGYEAASVKSRRKVMASSSRLPMQQKCKNLEGVEAWRRPDTRRHRR